MPRLRRGLMGSPTVLMMLLGYKTEPSSKGVPAGNGQYAFTAAQRGTRPKGQQRQETLKMLAGPHGQAIAKAIAIKRGIDLSKWPYWP